MFSLIPWREHRGRSGGLMHPLDEMRTEFDALLDRFFGGWPESIAGEHGAHRFWNFDVTENDNEIVIRAEMPGFDPNDIKVEVRGDMLTISGEKKQEGKEQQSVSRFQRSLTLPQDTDTEKAQATFHNGMLELHLPVKEEARPRRIQVQAKGGTSSQQQAPSAAQSAGQATAQGTPSGGQPAGRPAQSARQGGK